MKRQTVIVAAVIIGLTVEVSAENPPAASSRDAALADLASKEAEAALLRGQLAEWEKVLAEANQARQRYEDFMKGARDARDQDTDVIKDTDGTVVGKSMIRSGPIAAAANQAIGRGDVAWSQIQKIKQRLGELARQIAAARAQLDRFNKPPKAGTSPFAASADPRANEPPGGVKVTSGPGYVPETRPGEKPGLSTDLPNWINTNPQSAGNTQTPAAGAYPPVLPGGPMSGPGWPLPPTSSPINLWQPWPPYLNPWPVGGGTPGHGHTPTGKDMPSGGSGHKHGTDGKDIR
ncbi:MAG: hypothetical protein HZA91_04095 [Verrucomicrobia bacterium]|nr:hypothetical protein [Verrucomicrobiota bacterium]